MVVVRIVVFAVRVVPVAFLFVVAVVSNSCCCCSGSCCCYFIFSSLFAVVDASFSYPL